MGELLRRLLGGGGRAQMFASHRGELDADLRRFVGSYPLWPALLAVAWLLSLLAVIDGFHWGAILFFAIVTWVNFVWWTSARSWFRTGDVCAAAVVSTEPLLVASFTDLSVGDGACPAIKICREPAKRWPAEIKVGSPVACVARYDGNAQSGHWTNFYPRPVQCATSDQAEIKRLLSEIDKPRWAALQAAIRQIPKPYRPGLYRVDLPTG